MLHELLDNLILRGTSTMNDCIYHTQKCNKTRYENPPSLNRRKFGGKKFAKYLIHDVPAPGAKLPQQMAHILNDRSS